MQGWGPPVYKNGMNRVLVLLAGRRSISEKTRSNRIRRMKLFFLCYLDLLSGSHGGNSLFGGRFSVLEDLQQPEDDTDVGVKEVRGAETRWTDRKRDPESSLKGKKCGFFCRIQQVQIKSFLCKSHILSKNKRVISISNRKTD